MSRGVLAIFGPVIPESYNTLKTFSNSFHIPYITWDSPIYEDEEPLQTENDVDDSTEDEIRTKDEFVKKKIDVDNDDDNSEYDELLTGSDISNFQLFLYPDISPMLIELIKQNRWKTLYYIYNHERGS